jgi:hypothetical protein
LPGAARQWICSASSQTLFNLFPALELLFRGFHCCFLRSRPSESSPSSPQIPAFPPRKNRNGLRIELSSTSQWVRFAPALDFRRRFWLPGMEVQWGRHGFDGIDCG